MVTVGSRWAAFGEPLDDDFIGATVGNSGAAAAFAIFLSFTAFLAGAAALALGSDSSFCATFAFAVALVAAVLAGAFGVGLVIFLALDFA